MRTSDLTPPVQMGRLGDFFDLRLPDHIKDQLSDTLLLAQLDQQQILRTINLSPPFLKIQKMLVVNSNGADVLQSRGLGMGVVTQGDTKGHYNDLISLALCGQLMASAAAIHLTVLFPNSAPQAIEVNGVKPYLKSQNGVPLFRPFKEGTPFFTESTIVRKKMRFVWMMSKISFADIQYGVIEELKFVLIPNEVLNSAQEIRPG